MARGSISPTQLTRSGVAAPAETNGDPVNGHTISNDGKTFLLVRNSNGGSTARTVTFQIGGTIDGHPVQGRAVSIAAGASRYFGPFPSAQYPASINVDVDNAELKLSAFRL